MQTLLKMHHGGMDHQLCMVLIQCDPTGMTFLITPHTNRRVVMSHEGARLILQLQTIRFLRPNLPHP